jgi:hypothetical protein
MPARPGCALIFGRRSRVAPSREVVVAAGVVDGRAERMVDGRAAKADGEEVRDGRREGRVVKVLLGG